MRTAAHLAGSVLGLVLLSPIFPAVVQCQTIEVPSHAQLREELRRLWEGIATLEYRLESQSPGDGRSGSGVRFSYEIAIGPNGRRSARVVLENDKDRSPHVQDIRSDGQKEYIVEYLEGTSDVIAQVRINNVQGSPGVGGITMNEALWLFAPGGKPLYEYIDSSAKLSAAEASKLLLEFDIDRHRRVKCVLDPDRDLLPTQLVLTYDKGSDIFIADKFIRDNGRWFPAEGRMISPGHALKERRFVVTQLRINRLMDDSRFGVPRNLKDGVVVWDRTSRTKVRFVGGEAGRRRFAAKYASLIKKASEGELLTAPRDPPASLAAFVVGGLSIMLIAVAFILHRYRR